jgi:hypothetical protein
MTPASGLVNQAANALSASDGSLPGWFYYGVNGADRGLGYRGSYMTLGGFIPYAEDDLGGLWAADLRGHLSNYGGFFSNVGMVRKQFIGGTLLGVGVFWDYDGDENQYPNTIITDLSGSYLFGGGETYNQVGVSGEWLTDYGNLRSNGYIPVGSTANTMGPFVGNSLLAVNGLNAALGGADLEVGAYIPGLADWAGMVSVGGYAFGNASYQFPSGADVVPWFGGVYTRLDMTFIENWDFSLQANNDSYFDWTGFARLTYRMGSSRRRNVPDQVEQPIMRNEHIVRAHQAPVQAINPTNGLPWHIIHVDNSVAVTGRPAAAAATAGAGTFESPFRELVDARDAATREFDVVYLHAGISHKTPYGIPVPPAAPLLNPDPRGLPPQYPNTDIANSYFFNANNQYLVGEGTSLKLNTVSNGPVPLSNGPNTGVYPVIANAAGTAVVLTDPTGSVTNANVDHIQIQDSYIGISDGPGLPTNGYAYVNDVRIIGTGPSQRGVDITAPGSGRSTMNFTNMFLSNLTRDGFSVTPAPGAASEPNVNITNSVIRNIAGAGVTTENLVGDARVRVSGVQVFDTSDAGVHVRNSQALVLDSVFRRNGLAGVQAEDSSIVQVSGSRFAGQEIGIQGTSTSGRLYLTASDNIILLAAGGVGNGIVLATPDPITDSTIYANIVGNDIISRGDQDIVLFDGTDGTNVPLPGGPDLFIKAADAQNLRIINQNATVYRVFPNDPTPLVPPPPRYDPALDVLLPPQ